MLTTRGLSAADANPQRHCRSREPTQGDARRRGAGSTLPPPGVSPSLAPLAGGQPVPLLPAAVPACAAQSLRCRSPGEVPAPPLFATPGWARAPASLFGMPAGFPATEGEGAEICSNAMPASVKPTNAQARIRTEMATRKPRMTCSSCIARLAPSLRTIRQARSHCLDGQ